MMSVGTLIAERTPRASVSATMRIKARIPEGLTAYRSKRAHDWRKPSSEARLGAKSSALIEPVPQAASTRSRKSSVACSGAPMG
jgi:hypothetical protein